MKNKKKINRKNLRKFWDGTPAWNGFAPGSGFKQAGYELGQAANNTELQYRNGYSGLQQDANNIRPGFFGTISNVAAKAAPLAANIIQNTAKNAAGKLVFNAAGKAMGAASAASGIFNTINSIGSYGDNVLSPQDALATADQSTKYINGVAYKDFGNVDAEGLLDYTKAKDSSDRLDTALSVGETASGLLALTGNPVLSGIGFVGGTLLGSVLDPIFGWSRKAEQGAKNVAAAADYQAQTQTDENKDDAATQGLRNMFNSRHIADKGKNPGQHWMNGKNAQTISTPYGPAKGKALGLASPDEGMIDMATGETYYLGSPSFNVKDKRKDVVPVGMPSYDNGKSALSDYASKRFDNTAVVGHKIGLDGNVLADKARPLFKSNEQLKMGMADTKMQMAELQEEMYKNQSNAKRNASTKKFVEKRLQMKANQLQQSYQNMAYQKQQNTDAIRNIVAEQSLVSQNDDFDNGYADGGKLPKFDLGDNITPEMLQQWTEQLAGPYVQKVSDPIRTLKDTLDAKDLSKALNGMESILNQKPISVGSIPSQSAVDLINTDPNVKANGFKPIIKYPTKKTEYEPVRNNIGLPAWAGLAQALPTLREMRENAYQQPWADNSFVVNPNAVSAQNILGGLGYRNDADHAAVEQAVRNSIYNLYNTAGLSAGQRARLAANHLIRAQQAHSAINQEVYNKNASYKVSYADMLNKNGIDYATRKQQADATQQKNYAEATGKSQSLRDNYSKQKYKVGQQFFADESTRDLYGRYLDLYNMQLKNPQA